MNENIYSELHDDLPRDDAGRSAYTRRAFEMLPHVETPRILDVGCGRGGPTLDLARLSGGLVVGMDIHKPYLEELARRTAAQGLSGRVHAVECSLFDMCFCNDCFDVIWSEGSVFVIGFEKALLQWRRCLKPYGCMAVHEMVWLRPDPPPEILDYWMRIYSGIGTVPQVIGRVSRCGFKLLGHFALPEDAWWAEYYDPLEERVRALRGKYRGDPAAQLVLDGEQHEIDLYRKYQSWYGSAFFVMQAP